MLWGRKKLQSRERGWLFVVLIEGWSRIEQPRAEFDSSRWADPALIHKILWCDL